MAYVQSVTFTTANQYVIDLAAFVSANGWTVDINGVYDTSWRRLHFHKGSAHFEVVSTAALAWGLYGCTGLNSGVAPNLQPGATTVKNENAYGWLPTIRFISTVGGIFVCAKGTNYTQWEAFFIIQNKIGTWSDGWGIQGGVSNYGGGGLMHTTAYTPYIYAQLYINGAWTSMSTATGVTSNNSISSTFDLARTAQPSRYNMGLMPIPLTLFMHSSTTAGMKHPLGYLPGVYRTNVRDIYTFAEEFTIGADNYIALTNSESSVGLCVGMSDLILKLGA
jgi:hypothetical protein